MQHIYKFSIFCCLVLLSTIGIAQSKAEPGAIATENGIFIYTGGNLEKNGHYTIERRGEKDRKFAEIAKTKLPNSLSEVEQLASKAATYFEHLVPLSAKDNNRIFEYVQAYKTDDSLYRAEHLPIIAITAGTGFLDTTVEKDKLYVYQITLYNNGKEVSKKVLKAVKNTVQTNLPSPKKFKSEVVNKAVFLEWIVGEQQEMSTFNVYRAYFGTLEFKKLDTKKGYSNSDDGMHLIAIDSSAEESSLYKYYIQPVDIYGNVAEISEVISIGKLQAESIIPITSLKTEALEDYKIKLSWQLDKSAITSNIQVLRSDNFDDGFVEIMNLPPATTEFIDDLPEASENYYYYLKVSGGKGQEFKSAKIAAIIKNNTEVLPGPNDVSGIAIEDGVEISWRYDEPYTRGFYVYRASANSEKFNQISNLIPVDDNDYYSYKDENENLKAGEMYRYTVRAENDAYTLGKFSDTVHTISGKKPKIETPRKLSAVFRDSVVELYWEDLRETSKNLLGYKLYRKSGINSLERVLPNDTLKPYKNYYNDKTINKGETYTYQVSAIDLFGQESVKSVSTTVIIPNNEAVIDVPSKPIAYKNSDGIVISWNQIANDDIKNIKIYRSKANEKAKVIKTVLATNETYLDSSVRKGTLYYYKIVFVNADKKEGSVSREVSIYY